MKTATLQAGNSLVKMIEQSKEHLLRIATAHGISYIADMPKASQSNRVEFKVPALFTANPETPAGFDLRDEYEVELELVKTYSGTELSIMRANAQYLTSIFKIARRGLLEDLKALAELQDAPEPAPVSQEQPVPAEQDEA